MGRARRLHQGGPTPREVAMPVYAAKKWNNALAAVGSARWWQRAWPWLTLAGIAVGTALLLRLEGRRWWCACGQLYPWNSDPRGPHNSQHLFDPYSFIHV